MVAKRLVLRIPIRVSTLDAKTGETIDNSTYTKQTQLLKFVQSQTKKYRNKDVAFVARVMYNRIESVYNEFEFDSAEDFEQKLAPCLERPLLKDLVKDGLLSKDLVSGL